MTELNPWDWLGIGLVFLVLELIISGVFLMWVGFSALSVALLLALVPLSWKIQLVISGSLTLVYIVLWTYFGKSKFQDLKTSEQNLNSRSMNYIGQTRPLLEAIVGGKGVIVIDDSRWVVSGPDAPEGSSVKILSVDGSTLIVELVNAEDHE